MRARRRIVVLVLDGLGVGEMADRPDEDAGSHTLAHVVEHSRVELPTLRRLGLGNAAMVPGWGALSRPAGAFGVSNLGYPGADSHLGHQEMMGAGAHAELCLLADVRDGLIDALHEGGRRVDELEHASSLIVDGSVLVADNIEAKPGLGINVSGSLDDRPFEELVDIGLQVRAAVAVPRVIVAAGRGFGIAEMVSRLTGRSSGQVGLDTPALGMYDAHFRVRHLISAAPATAQAPSLVAAAGGVVTLIGKAADVVCCDAATLLPAVDTGEILDQTLATLAEMDGRGGLVVANVQETDLAGHEQDPMRFADALRRVDMALPALLSAMAPRDVLLVTADHGNDPCAGHSQHTRERVPILLAGHAVRPGSLGTRSSLADIGATITDLFGAMPPAQGNSFAQAVA